MKFHCDRCKTRYSIADDRVRGKILKIRCKNCSSVITVKEGGSVSNPRMPRQVTGDGISSSAAGGSRQARRRPTTSSGSALQGAFEQALREPQGHASADSTSSAPAVLEAEWYVSQDGEQFGPFVLQKAQDWVSTRPPDDELYCWSEGFDDWLPVEKVSHFRGLRGQAQTVRHSSGMYSMGDNGHSMEGVPPELSAGFVPAHEDTPVPLFAATLAQVVADTPKEAERHGEAPMRRNGSSVSPLGLPSSRPPSSAGGGSLFASAYAAAAAAPAHTHGQTVDDPNDLEIGEASRVVKLPMLARHMGGAAPMSAPGLPGMTGASSGIGRGTGNPELPGVGLPVIQGGASVEAPRPEILQPRRRRSGMMLPIAIGSSVVVGLVTVLLYVALASEDDDARVRRGQVGGSGLAYQYEDDEEDGGKKPDKAPASNGRSRRVARKASSARSSTAPAMTPPTAPTGSDFDEVDLSGSGGGVSELDGGDILEVVSANRIGVQMCYNSALKRDPLLKVRRADVAIRVSPSGAVSSVSIPALNGTQLGLCLEKRIGAWRFPRGTETFSGRFPIVFQSS
ncbi:MAG TPA: AgmX/PglI C-terminal domain-containing protein [Kofleriaceae bacterium]|nr:AgmX/PglI C-terminal domain-containing protein [Kofleriaceae bacterium]